MDFRNHSPVHHLGWPCGAWDAFEHRLSQPIAILDTKLSAIDLSRGVCSESPKLPPPSMGISLMHC